MNDADRTKKQLVAELDNIPSGSEEDYKKIFELFPIGITTVDMKGIITSCNDTAHRIGGWSEPEIVGKHFSEISSLQVKDIPKYIRLFSSIIRGKIPKPFDATYQCMDGTTGWTELHISLIKAGGKQRILVIQHDITERKRAEEALQESEERYRDLFDNASEMIQSVNPAGKPWRGTRSTGGTGACRSRSGTRSCGSGALPGTGRVLTAWPTAR